MLKKADQYDFVMRAHEVFVEAGKTFEQLKEEEGLGRTDLEITIHDVLRNLIRKTEAYLEGQISIEKLNAEVRFEEQVMTGEIEIRRDENPRLVRFAKKLLESITEYIIKSGAEEEVKELAQHATVRKSKGVAYTLWFFGFFGMFGFHRFYLQQIGMGIAWALSGGLFGVGAIYDFFTLGRQVDEHNDQVALKELKQRQLQEKQTKLLQYKKPSPNQ